MGFGVVLTDKQRLFGNNPGKFFAGTPFALTTIRSRKKYEVNEREEINMGTILLIILILLLVGALPTWPYSSGWGYYPSGGLGLVLVIFIVLLLMGRLTI